jgi:hypothetical protein
MQLDLLATGAMDVNYPNIIVELDSLDVVIPLILQRSYDLR